MQEKYSWERIHQICSVYWLFGFWCHTPITGSTAKYDFELSNDKAKWQFYFWDNKNSL